MPSAPFEGRGAAPGKEDLMSILRPGSTQRLPNILLGRGIRRIASSKAATIRLNSRKGYLVPLVPLVPNAPRAQQYGSEW